MMKIMRKLGIKILLLFLVALMYSHPGFGTINLYESDNVSGTYQIVLGPLDELTMDAAHRIVNYVNTQKISQVNICGSLFSESAIDVVLQSLFGSHLRYFIMGYIEINQNRAQIIARALGGNRVLQMLDFCASPLRGAEALAIVRALVNDNFTLLVLNMAIQDEPLSRLANLVLSRNRLIRDFTRAHPEIDVRAVINGTYNPLELWRERQHLEEVEEIRNLHLSARLQLEAIENPDGLSIDFMPQSSFLRGIRALGGLLRTEPYDPI